MGITGWLLLSTVGQAVTPEEWAGLYNGRLSAAHEQDPEQAITIYETILSKLSATDPLRGDLLYWLGRAHYDAGNHDAARAALLGASAAPGGQETPQEMVDTLQTWSQRIRSIPSTAQPDASITANNPWHLVFDHLSQPVREVTLQLQAQEVATIIRVDLMTMDGRHLPSLEAVELPADTWTALTLDLSDFRSVQPETDQQLWMVSLQQHSASLSANATVRVGEVQIR